MWEIVDRVRVRTPTDKVRGDGVRKKEKKVRIPEMDGKAD